MAKAKNDEPDPEQLPAEDEKRLDHPVAAAKLRPKATPYEGEPTQQEGETTRVLLTGDNRTVLTERYVPTATDMFRINVDGQFYEHVGEGEGGVWIYAPTR